MRPVRKDNPRAHGRPREEARRRDVSPEPARSHSDHTLTSYRLCREISYGLKLHKKLCQQNFEKLGPFVDKYREDDREAKTDVAALRNALFPKDRKVSGPYQTLLE